MALSKPSGKGSWMCECKTKRSRARWVAAAAAAIVPAPRVSEVGDSRMGDKPVWEQTGSSFIQHYYQLFDNDRTQLGTIYIDASCLTWEGQQFQGKAAIVEKPSVRENSA